MGQHSSTASTITPANEIADADKRWCEALSAHNAGDLQDLYTEDAKVLNCPNCQPEATREDLPKLIEWFQAEGCTAAKLSAKEIQQASAAKNGTTLWDREKYVFQQDSVVKFNGNKVVVWRRENGQLKIHIDSWNPVNNIN